VTVNRDGTFTYVPAAGFVGDDSFTYRADDGAEADQGEVTVTVTDVSGPQARPTLSPEPNPDGWNQSDVTVTWNWADGASGVDADHCTGETASSGEGEMTLTSTCRDLAGNEATASQTVRIDTSAPSATITAPKAKGYWQGAVVTADYSCADEVSGIASCTGPVADGSPIDTSVPGSHTFTVTARDWAGNEHAATVSYTVVARPTCAGLPATIIGTAGDDVLTGTPGDDVIVTRGGRDRITARGGNDTICTGILAVGGGGGHNPTNTRDLTDVVYGGPGNDTVFTGGGDDAISGADGDDSIFAGGGRDTILGGAGDDVIGGSRGRDTLVGGADDDQLTGGPRTDSCRGGIGADQAVTCELIVGIP
jgi:Ca2+-binding RTX toxin-like protein